MIESIDKHMPEAESILSDANYRISKNKLIIQQHVDEFLEASAVIERAPEVAKADKKLEAEVEKDEEIALIQENNKMFMSSVRGDCIAVTQKDDGLADCNPAKICDFTSYYFRHDFEMKQLTSHVQLLSLCYIGHTEAMRSLAYILQKGGYWKSKSFPLDAFPPGTHRAFAIKHGKDQTAFDLVWTICK